MGRTPCCDKSAMKKGPWTPEEDEKLVAYINKHGQGNWHAIPKNAGLARCGKSCRLRWNNYLRPDIKRGCFSSSEEDTIILLHGILGNKWSAIAAWLPGRTDNEIKNHWNTNIRKRLLRTGIDLVTHEPRPDLVISAAAPYCYPYSYSYTMQAAADLNTNYTPDLLHLASNLLLSGPGPAAPTIADQQLLPWTVQPATMAQEQVVPLPPLLPQPQQLVAQHACQLPDLMQMVHQHQLAAVQQQPQDMMEAAACSRSMEPPTGTGNVVDTLLDVPVLMQMQMETVQAVDASSMQQWSHMW